jgi:hypothetical protein
MLNSVIYKHVTNARGVFQLDIDIGIGTREDDCGKRIATSELEAVKRVYQGWIQLPSATTGE